MIKIIKKAPENVAAFRATGEISKEDFDVVFRRVKEVINQEGELNYLLELDTDVKNFSAGAWISDLMVGVKHLTKWNRCAIISDSTIIDKVTELMNKFTIGEFKVFDHEEKQQAMKWVSTGKVKSKGGNFTAALAAGFGGAVALNILHETVRKNFDNVPEVNKVGEEALVKTLNKVDVTLNGKDEKYLATLAGDIVSNGIYYAATAAKMPLLSGLAAGVGAVTLPSKMGLDDTPVAGTTQKKVMTISYYVVGALVTAGIYKLLKNKK